MRIRIWPNLTILIFALVAILHSLRADDKPSVPPDHARQMQQGLALFKEKVRPALVRHCLDCHGGKSTKGDLDLTDRKPLGRQRSTRRWRQGEPARRIDPARRRAAHASEGSEAA